MNETKLEALSALMDGEAAEGDAGMLREWTRDEGLRSTWARYHIISDCLHRTMPAFIDPALASRIAVALRNEPSIIAAPETAAPRAWLRPLAGMAIAASVATLAVIGIQVNRGGPGGPEVAAQTPETQAARGGQFNLASGNAARKPLRVVGPRANLDPRMNRYLIDYSEQRPGNALQGMPPYVRIIADDQGEKP